MDVSLGKVAVGTEVGRRELWCKIQLFVLNFYDPWYFYHGIFFTNFC